MKENKVATKVRIVSKNVYICLMKKEAIEKAISEMPEYVPVRIIERSLGMPKTTIQKVLKGKRELPKKWVKPLEKYFFNKLGGFYMPEGKDAKKVTPPKIAMYGSNDPKDGKPPPIPVRREGEDPFDFAARKNDWKRLYGK